jgi:hypothetical protein
MASLEFPFVLDLLQPKAVVQKKMFGCTALYSGEKILMIFRLKKSQDPDNGIWIATVPEHHESLQKDFPSMRSIRLFGKGPTTWQNLPVEAVDFENSVERLCTFVKQGDPRIGKVPGKKAKPKGGRLKKAKAQSAVKKKPSKRKLSAPRH